MSDTEMLLVPVLVGIITALIEVIKAFAEKKKNGNGNFSVYRKLDDIHDIVTQKGSDGRPLLYVSHDILKSQIEILETLKEIARTEQEMLLRIKMLKEDMDGRERS